MGDLWTDLQLALTLFVFVYIVQWAIGITGSKRIGILLSIVIIYLTIYQHVELLVLTVMFFFGYAFFETFESTFVPYKK